MLSHFGSLKKLIKYIEAKKKQNGGQNKNGCHARICHRSVNFHANQLNYVIWTKRFIIAFKSFFSNFKMAD
jgi:hypothetical protein